MLINNQNAIVEDMFMSLKDKKLFNIPTGVGKTYIFIELAKRIIKRLNKKVIISTSTNQLVKEFYSVAENHFQFPINNMKIQIGKSNYLDYNQYIFFRRNGELEELIEESSLKSFDKSIENDDKEQIFFDDFHQHIQYKDIASKEYVIELLKKRSGDTDVFTTDLTLTNHFFLISSIKHSKINIFDDYVVLMDETHTMGEVAQTILSKDFSLFSTKISLNRLNKELTDIEDFVGKEAIKKNIRTLMATTGKMLLRYSCEFKLDNSATEKDTIKYLSRIEEFSNNKTVQTLQKQLLKKEKLFGREAKILINELGNIKNIVQSGTKDIKYINLSYTPSRGYPLLSSFSENPLGFLNRILWQKLQFFVGVSATICPSFNPNKKEIAYSLARIGLLGESKEIEFYDKFFPKELIDIYTPDKEAPDYVSIYDDNFDKENSIYHQYIVNYIHKNHNNKNTIVFCSGYKEVEYLSNLYKILFDDVKIHNASKFQTSTQTLKEFRNVGGILFATRDYGTGVTLKGKLLENIFILRLPYPITSNYKWELLKKKSMNTFMTHIKYEMLITLMQWLGRLQRTTKDEGSIYLMDKRYFSSLQLKSKIDNILNYYGVLKDISGIESKNKDIGTIDENDRKMALCELDKLLGF